MKLAALWLSMILQAFWCLPIMCSEAEYLNVADLFELVPEDAPARILRVERLLDQHTSILIILIFHTENADRRFKIVIGGLPADGKVPIGAFLFGSDDVMRSGNEISIMNSPEVKRKIVRLLKPLEKSEEEFQRVNASVLSGVLEDRVDTPGWTRRLKWKFSRSFSDEPINWPDSAAK